MADSPFLLAYIDPIAGSIVLQAVIAAGVGTVAFFRRSIGRVFQRLFRRKPSDR